VSTPVAGNDGDERRGASSDGPRRADGADTPTEMMDTGQSGARPAGASQVASSGASQAGSGNGSRGDAGDDYVPGAYSPDDDASGEYVPGMYSGGSDDTESRTDSTPTRQQATAPIPASSAASTGRGPDAATQAQTRVAPVTATRNADAGSGDSTRDHRLPRSATAGTGVTGVPSLEDRKVLHQREKEHFGGMKFGAAFFGWLTATGLFVLLSALVGALAGLFGYGANLSTSDLTSGSGEAQTAGITAAVVLGVILLVSYFAGGYVAGRMARFSGIKQGVAVWLWAIIVAVVLAIIGFVVGNQANVTERFQDLGVPAMQDVTGPGLIGLLVVAAVALIGAILGGLTGMRYHRRIDRTDFDALDNAE
jgi:hypothetical protein